MWKQSQALTDTNKALKHTKHTNSLSLSRTHTSLSSHSHTHTTNKHTNILKTTLMHTFHQSNFPFTGSATAGSHSLLKRHFSRTALQIPQDNSSSLVTHAFVWCNTPLRKKPKIIHPRISNSNDTKRMEPNDCCSRIIEPGPQHA